MQRRQQLNFHEFSNIFMKLTIITCLFQLENDALNLLSQFDDNPPKKDEGKVNLFNQFSKFGFIEMIIMLSLWL